eukprot:CAMPEP_0202857886 /NCGR_PEP_ID=MMETSP1391-20130828/652_1 /ASSEMBLY_ACC=CAM_ASM_000867 /TAXON_ID=1034604 /ORGANISM="Chlamydomonas leiostraca, Strain SAG 11-49" /LENGTH=531 /DNA_ID=CAMNT_0049536745 /DNA_START=118 /DNA_END=1713 /DNA_ORIENTATION=+
MMPGAVQQPSQQNSWRAAEQTPVCPEPKVFAGQIPFESTTQDVQNLFAQYGNIRSCQVITGPDGRSKGCAMILYSTWTEAELAVENENGTQHLGGQKPMVVKFADPPKRGDGPIVGIAAKKLFVGQIPPNMTEEALRAMFQPYGNITEVHLLKKNPGSGCAFVCYDRWSACEAAVAALHGKHQLEGAKMPIVVKFADAKVDGFAGSKRGFESMAPNGQHAMFNNGGMPGNMGGGANGKKAFTSMGQGQGFNPYGMGMGYGMGGPMGQMGYGMGQMGMMGMGMQGMGMGMQGMNMGGMGGMGMNGGMRQGGQKAVGTGNSAMQANKMGSGVVEEAAKQWKLFVGQVPFEASEGDLWPIFSAIGNILELVVLRTPQGKSKGCAFVTYENRMMAEKAIRQLDGQVCVPDDPKQRLLIVKYAGGAGGAPGAAAAALGQHDGGQGEFNAAAASAGAGYGLDPAAAAMSAMQIGGQQGQQQQGMDAYAQQMQQQMAAQMQQSMMQQQHNMMAAQGMGAPGQMGMAPMQMGMGQGMGF